MSGPEDEFDGAVAQLDVRALETVRSVMERDGLVVAAGFDNLFDPDVLQVQFGDGIGEADWARYDIEWRRGGVYYFHHTDSAGQDFRWGRHPKRGAPDAHFHPPPGEDVSVPVASCIDVEEPMLVARAVHKLWRRAYDSGDLSALDTASNPP